MDPLYKKVLEHWEEVTVVPPQTVGKFTPLYKEFTKRLKVMPWPVLTLISIVVVIGLYVVIGSAITFLTSVLQRGF